MLILVEEKILWLSIPKSIWIQSAYSIKQIGTIQMWWNGKVINYSSEWATISKISPFITIIDSSSTQPLKFILQQLSWKILFFKRIVKSKWMKSLIIFFNIITVISLFLNDDQNMDKNVMQHEWGQKWIEMRKDVHQLLWVRL